MAAVLSTTAAVAQLPLLIEDLSPPVPGQANGSTYPEPLTEVGGKILFRGSTAATGPDLWSFDPVVDQAELLVDSEGFRQLLGSTSTKVVFSARAGSNERLWATDGTSAGTHLIDVGGDAPVPSETYLLSEPCRRMGDRVFFIEGDWSDALWVTDGTVAGTIQVATSGIPSVSPLFPCARVGSANWFAKIADGGSFELWSSHGTPASTAMMTALPVFPDGSMVSIGSRVVFFAESTGRPWSSNGTSLGSFELATSTSAQPTPLGALLEVGSGRVVFVFDDGVHGDEIWSTDGTPGGTIRLTDLVAPSPFSVASGERILAIAGDRVVFYAAPVNGGWPRLWSVPVAGGPTIELATVCVDPSCFNGFHVLLSLGDRAVFLGSSDATGVQLHVTDGTLAGTERLGSAPSDFGSQAIDLHRSGDRAVLRATTAPVGQELWETDGTDAGTRRITELPYAQALTAGGNSPLSTLTALGRTWFAAGDPVHGAELWSTNGDPASTSLEVDVGFSFPGSDPIHLVGAAEHVTFVAHDGLDLRWWRSDGTAEGTVSFPIDPILAPDPNLRALAVAVGHRVIAQYEPVSGPAQIVALDPRAGDAVILTGFGYDGLWSLPFQFRDEAGFFERTLEGRFRFWLTGGTPATTRPVVEFPQIVVALGNPQAAGGLLFVTTVTEEKLNDVWRSDGTAAGTFRLQMERFDNSSPYHPKFIAAGERVFFKTVADDFTLYVTDGTVSGTTRFIDYSSSSPGASEFTSVGGALYVVGPPPGSPIGLQLYRTPTDEFEPTLLKAWSGSDFVVGPLVSTGSRVFFTLRRHDPEEVELWSSDGTPAGSLEIAIASTLPSANPRLVTAVGDRAFFTATDGIHGEELWSSAGTEQSTAMVADLAAGAHPAQVQRMYFHDCRLFFVADDTQTGLEPWMLDFDVCPGLVFSDGFESGDTGAWSGSTP